MRHRRAIKSPHVSHIVIVQCVSLSITCIVFLFALAGNGGEVETNSEFGFCMLSIGSGQGMFFDLIDHVFSNHRKQLLLLSITFAVYCFYLQHSSRLYLRLNC